MHGEGVSTPHVRPKGRQPLIECANMTLIFTFPLRSYIFYALFYIFLFLWSTRVFSLCSYVFLNFVMRKSDLRSSFLCVNQVILFYLKGDHFKALDLKNDPFYLVRN